MAQRRVQGYRSAAASASRETDFSQRVVRTMQPLMLLGLANFGVQGVKGCGWIVLAAGSDSGPSRNGEVFAQPAAEIGHLRVTSRRRAESWLQIGPANESPCRSSSGRRSSPSSVNPRRVRITPAISSANCNCLDMAYAVTGRCHAPPGLVATLRMNQRRLSRKCDQAALRLRKVRKAAVRRPRRQNAG